jgi:hypothetical protein
MKGSQVSFFYASYAEKLSLEHSIKCLRLIQSRWYQERWGHRFKMIRESAGHIESNRGGYRMASSVDAKATGYGARTFWSPTARISSARRRASR